MARTRGSLALCAVFVVAASCEVVQSVAEAPGKLFGVFARGPDGKAVDLEVVRNDALRYADRIVGRVEIATRIFAGRLSRQEATEGVSEKDRLEGAERGLTWRLNTADRAYQTATQARPIASLVDLLAMCVYERRVHELYWSERYGEADEIMHTVWDSLSAEGQETVQRLLSKELGAVVTRVIAKWEEGATDPDELQRAGPPRFEDLVPKDLGDEETTTLLGALGLDPLDSIEPAAREIARSRELGERAVFLAQRAPRTLAWRVELLTLQLTRQDDVQTVIASVERTSKSFENASAAIQSLPEQLRIEGQALIRDLSQEVAKQRAGLTQDLEGTIPATQSLLETASVTLDSGTETARAIEAMANAFNSDESESSASGSPPAEVAESEPGPPFDPNDYTLLAAQTTRVLEELNTATGNVETSLPALRDTIDGAGSRLDQSIDRAYGHAVKLLLIAVGAVALAIAVLRFVPSRRRRDASG